MHHVSRPLGRGSVRIQRCLQRHPPQLTGVRSIGTSTLHVNFTCSLGLTVARCGLKESGIRCSTFSVSLSYNFQPPQQDRQPYLVAREQGTAGPTAFTSFEATSGQLAHDNSPGTAQGRAGCNGTPSIALLSLLFSSLNTH